MTQALAKKFKAPSVKQTPLAIPSGKIVDFISGRFFRDTPEEYVRQNIEKALVHQYHYDPIDCVPALSIKIGSDRKQVDIAVFKPGVEHKQHSIWLIVETKAAGVPPHACRRRRGSAAVLHGGLPQL